MVWADEQVARPSITSCWEAEEVHVVLDYYANKAADALNKQGTHFVTQFGFCRYLMQVMMSQLDYRPVGKQGLAPIVLCSPGCTL